MFTNDSELYHKLFYSHNFGHNGPLDFHGLGINGKISELQAAMGLAVFPYLEEIFRERKRVCDYYDQQLDFSALTKIKIREGTIWNYSYYPVIFNSEEDLLKIQNKLNELGIIPRRYFYPSLNSIKYTSGNTMQVSEQISTKVLCLPLYTTITNKELEQIVTTINDNLC